MVTNYCQEISNIINSIQQKNINLVLEEFVKEWMIYKENVLHWIFKIFSYIVINHLIFILCTFYFLNAYILPFVSFFFNLSFFFKINFEATDKEIYIGWSFNVNIIE